MHESINNFDALTLYDKILELAKKGCFMSEILAALDMTAEEFIKSLELDESLNTILRKAFSNACAYWLRQARANVDNSKYNTELWLNLYKELGRTYGYFLMPEKE